ncbi:MAG: GGDEF domain-containing protein [Pseudomonadota bacterium]
MDPLTAATALVLVQLCLALVMGATFYAAPTEKCTRHWALSGLFMALGVLMVVLNAKSQIYIIQFAANASGVFGIIHQWWGLQTFYKKPASKWGWIIFASYITVLLAFHTWVIGRVFLTYTVIFIVISLSFLEVWKNQVPRRSFACGLTLCAVGWIALAHAYRILLVLSGNYELVPTNRSSFAVSVIYLAPIVGTLVYATGILLLYFERIINDKHFLATHDELTGLLNRRAIVEGGERELDVATRLGRPFCVAFIDIDFFKKINDELGHDTGDVVLAGVAQTLKKACRSIDLVGRYGGEEFCIVFPDLDCENALVVGDRIMTAVREYRFNGTRNATVSIGFAVLSQGTPGQTWQNLIKLADDELYKAKSSGRNKYCFTCLGEDEATQATRNQLSHAATATENMATLG